MEHKYTPEKGDFFISLAENFENAKIHHAFENDKDENKLSAYYIVYASKGQEFSTVKKRIEEFKKPFFPSFFYRRNDIKGLESEFEIYQRISRKIEDLLLTKAGYSNLISDTIECLINQGEDKEEIESIIKVLTSELLVYKYKKNKSGEFIEFSELKSNSEKSRLYYGSLADEIKIKSEKISLLVSHGQTVGNYREHILRGMLKKYIPSKFDVATGFIEGLSRQIDILIYDSQNHSPTFIEGDLVVVRREAVRAIIEVKSVLTTVKLQEALQFFYDITRPGIYKPEIPIFKGIFAFDTTYSDTNSLAKCIKDFYNEPYFEEQVQKNMTRDILYLLHEITCVTVLKKHCIFSQYIKANNNEGDNVIPALLSISDQRNIDVQTAMFIALLFDYLDVDYNAKQSTLKAFSKLHRSKTADIKIEVKLTNDDWFPRTAETSEHNFKQDTIKMRLKKIDDWFNGNISTTDFIKQETNEQKVKLIL
jgi:hypothetical protein